MPYHTRVSIDMKIFVGHWYSIRGRASQPPEIKLREDIVDRPVSFFFLLEMFFSNARNLVGRPNKDHKTRPFEYAFYLLQIWEKKLCVKLLLLYPLQRSCRGVCWFHHVRL